MGVVDVSVPAGRVEGLEYVEYGGYEDRSPSPHRERSPHREQSMSPSRAQPVPQPPAAERAARQSVGLLKQVWAVSMC